MTMIGLRRTVQLLSMVGAASHAHAEAYFCVGELSTGFRWSQEDGAWKTARFATKEDRFIFASQAADPSRYLATYVGETSARHHCTRQMHDGKPNMQIVCGGLGSGLIVNLETLRFQEVYTIGFVDGDDSLSNSPSMTVGSCAKVNE